MCLLSQSDARFPKYPRLPVIVCAGYEAERGETIANSIEHGKQE
jgi:hypothetical protein